MIELSEEAVNCLKFWQDHGMYGGSMSDVIVQNLHEWLCRDMTLAGSDEIEQEFTRVKKGA